MKQPRLAPTMIGALLLGALLCCGQCGCLTPQPGPGPAPGPGPTPQPTTQLSTAVAASLAGVPREDCLKLYGVFTALASYIEDGGKGVTSTAQLLQLTTGVLDNLNWAKGRYPALSQVVREALNSRFSQPQPIDAVKSQVVATFREIAAGCREAVR